MKIKFDKLDYHTYLLLILAIQLRVRLRNYKIYFTRVHTSYDAGTIDDVT